MSRRFLPALWAFTLLFLLMQAPVMAASYVVAPFKVSGAQGYSYLGQAVPSMLTSRLFLQGQFEPSAMKAYQADQANKQAMWNTLGQAAAAVGSIAAAPMTGGTSIAGTIASNLAKEKQA